MAKVQNREEVSNSTSKEYKPSRKSFIVNYISAFALLILLITLSVSIDFGQTSSLIMVVFIVAFISALLSEPEKKIKENSYILTLNEVMHIHGTFAKKQIVIHYKNIGTIKVNQSILGRIFNFGDILISGPKDDIVMKGLENISSIYKLINNRINITSK